MTLASFSKAIAGGIVGLLVAEAARFGFHPNDGAVDAINVLVTGIVGYVAGHVIVFIAPANK